MPSKGRIGRIEEVQRNVEELSLEWRIPGFLSLSGEGHDYYESPRFPFWGGCWYLTVFPDYDSWVDPSLNRNDSGISGKTVKVTFGVKGLCGVQMTKEEQWVFSNVDCWNMDEFCFRFDLSENRERLMPNDVFTLMCKMKAITATDDHNHVEDVEVLTEECQASEKQDACTQTDCNIEATVFSGEKQSLEKREVQKMAEDFGKLLASGEDSDVTVKVSDVEFKVHKVVFSARSPVLSAMLRHDTEERASNRISIRDCEPEDFREYLQFLYTGSVQSLTPQNAFGLYRIADQYLADNLKQLCLEHIRDTLSVQTFCEVVKLALMHGESNLLQLAIDFASKTLPLIIRSVEWQDFNREFPTEANEILIKCIKL